MISNMIHFPMNPLSIQWIEKRLRHARVAVSSQELRSQDLFVTPRFGLLLLDWIHLYFQEKSPKVLRFRGKPILRSANGNREQTILSIRMALLGGRPNGLTMYSYERKRQKTAALVNIGH